MIKVTQVRALEGFKLDVRLSDGTHGMLDCACFDRALMLAVCGVMVQGFMQRRRRREQLKTHEEQQHERSDAAGDLAPARAGARDVAMIHGCPCHRRMRPAA